MIKEFHIHLLNSPDIAAYSAPFEGLVKALSDISDERMPNFVVTESYDFSEITPEMRRADALVCYRLPSSRINELSNLRWIHLVSAGVDHLLPLDWLPERIVLTNNSGVHTELSGEYACCALLMLNCKIPRHATQQRLGGWDRRYNSPIVGKTVLIVGVGAIGGSAALRAKLLGLRVLGIRHSRQPHPHVDEMYGPQDLRRLLPQADFVLITAPLTPETKGMIGAEELALMKSGAGLVNMARAAIVDYDALCSLLESGYLSGAIVDVTDIEPLPAEATLRGVSNLLITPHISSDPLDYKSRTIGVIVDNVIRLLKGHDLSSRVQASRGY